MKIIFFALLGKILKIVVKQPRFRQQGTLRVTEKEYKINDSTLRFTEK